MNFKEYLRYKYGEGEPIYVEYIEYKGYSRSWKFLQLKKLVDAGVLRRFDTGIYYFPEKTISGESRLNTGKVINRRFITDGSDVYGYITGLSLLNSAGLSTQMPNLIEIATNKESARVRDIDVGHRRVRVRKSRTTITKDNVNTLQFLDLMRMINPAGMDETERFMLSRFIANSGVTKEAVQRYAGIFPSNAMKNLIESGAVYELA